MTEQARTNGERTQQGLREGYALRKATHADHAQLQSLIARSARALAVGDYTQEQVEGALQSAFGVDTQLIGDGTYFVVEHANAIVGCGGWSKRRTLFGGDAFALRDPAELDPDKDAARIRAFFVDRAHIRKGIGTALLTRCEADAQSRGFRRFELLATLPGVRLYTALGYARAPSVHHALGAHLTIEFVPMTKSAASTQPAAIPPRRDE